MRHCENEKAKINNQHAIASRQEQCICQKHQNFRRIIDKYGISEAAHMLRTEQEGTKYSYSMVDNFQPTCMRFVKQCYQKKLERTAQVACHPSSHEEIRESVRS